MGFWAHHNEFFLLFLLIFPRFTLLVATATPFGFLGWLASLFCPRLLAALLGTIYYWDTNPTLCVLAWIAALCGTGGEGGVANQARS